MMREPSTEAFVASDNFRNDDGFGFFFPPIGAPKLANARLPGRKDYH
jgi:hypothetical protein